MNESSIQQAIPHRPPMLLVDEIVARDGDKLVCRKTFREEEFFFQGHYPGYPLVPGVILCEAAMQVGGILLSQRVDDLNNGVPVATRMNNVRFRRMVRPGETVEIEVELRDQVARAYFLVARVSCDAKVAVRFEFACTLAEVSEK